MLGCADVLSPQISLRAEKVLLLFSRQLSRHRVVVIDSFQWNKTADTWRLTLGVALVVVEITVVGRRRYERRRQCSLRTAQACTPIPDMQPGRLPSAQAFRSRESP